MFYNLVCEIYPHAHKHFMFLAMIGFWSARGMEEVHFQNCWKAGIWGAILTFVLKFLLVDLMVGLLGFIPAFLSVIVMIAVFKVNSFKAGFIVALMSYFFGDSLFLAFVYSFGYFVEPIEIVIGDMLDLIGVLLTPITAIVAAYLGVRFVRTPYD